MGEDLILRVEAACGAAWPARRTDPVGDWLVRRSGGPTRRINSASPRTLSPRDPRPHLAQIAALYAAHAQPVIFRVPGFAHGIDAALDAAGFAAPEAPTATLHADLTQRRHAADPQVQLAPVAGADWLAARQRLTGDAHPAAFAAMLARIAGPVRFASVAEEGRIGAVGYAAIAHDLLVFESVATDPALRRRGLAQRCLSTLLAWAQDEGVAEGCLQVVADNLAAIGLYEALGFTTRLYDYHYRRQRI